MADLENIFRTTFRLPHGDCPLPEPGRGAPVIEHPGMLRIHKKTKKSPDVVTEKEERRRFQKEVFKELREGKITEEEADELLIIK